MQKPALLILAAGIGSRYGGLKQIDPIGPHGEIVLDYSAFDAWRAGFGKIVFVIQADLEDAFREHFAPALEGRLETAYVHQRADDLPEGFTLPPERRKPWGTGHAIWAARNAITEPFAAINADDFYGRHSFRVLGQFLAHAPGGAATPEYCMVAFRLRNTLSEHGSVSRGICTANADGLLTEVIERTRIEATENGGARFLDERGQWQALGGDEPASMNMWGFLPSLFPALETEFRSFLSAKAHAPKAEFYIPTVVDTLIKRKRCRTKVLHTDEKWFGMTYREDRERVVNSIRALITAGLYPERLWA